jgi:PBP1b-binding outer membrane lipoprotein LpoB
VKIYFFSSLSSQTTGALLIVMPLVGCETKEGISSLEPAVSTQAMKINKPSLLSSSAGTVDYKSIIKKKPETAHHSKRQEKLKGDSLVKIIDDDDDDDDEPPPLEPMNTRMAARAF